MNKRDRVPLCESERDRESTFASQCVRELVREIYTKKREKASELKI